MENAKQIKEEETEEAIKRQAEPIHEQLTEEFDSRELLLRLGQLTEFGAPFGYTGEVDCMHWEDDL